MRTILELVFWLSLGGLLHTYLIYPALLALLARGKTRAWPASTFGKSPPPFISVIMSVYNEEKVLAEKLDSLSNLEYPPERIAFFFGSDGSNDRSNEILSAFLVQDPRARFFPYPERQGKPGVINRLAAVALENRPAALDHLFLITDANVILSPAAPRLMARHFADPQMAIVDAHMTHTGLRAPGISRAENRYIATEVLLKYREGLLWGKMIGPFGGCYALRSTFFSPVPPTFLVDDFYIAMRAFERGGLAINDLEARCYEAVSHEIDQEYRRKARISAGNFQNLFTFAHLLWPPYRPLAFAFFSHKVLRWLGPFLMLAALGAGAALAWRGNLFYRSLFFLLIGAGVVLPLVDLALKTWHIHWMPLRGARYFMVMNVALFQGFCKFLKGIQSNVWEPPKRN
jgi:glycosyltransferase involved in cell wall biosynthesis